MKSKLIPKVTSLMDLRAKAASDKRYLELMMKACANLGGMATEPGAAYRWLEANAMETSEKGVVAEVNFCRDLVL